MQHTILKIASDVLGLPVTEGSSIEDVPGWDSLKTLQIVMALDGSYHVEDEAAGPGCENAGICATIQKLVVDRVNEQLDDVLREVTLKDLEEDYALARAFEQDMYYI